MNLVSVRVITDDVARLVAFYERVTGGSATWSTPDFAELVTTSGTLAIGSTRTVGLFGPGSAEAGANRSAILEFIVPDVDAEFARLRTWIGEFVTEPTTMPWGNRALLFRDPDGTLVNLFTPVSDDAVTKFAATPR
ncbi:VOC family protein [Actinomycetospora termitidis]|uniref:VOC family protein n=1 Tax=Actinomycetospora termitidis TaxID=3053470 RepID=A0ABT7MCB7_9PSEU|nr:VOC family protein [Actinomycetospora sp. Odt1-22]MDL5158304.1 VOC family protein [Actinomycetospora sp. Odt1-22]